MLDRVEWKIPDTGGTLEILKSARNDLVLSRVDNEGGQNVEVLTDEHSVFTLMPGQSVYLQGFNVTIKSASSGGRGSFTILSAVMTRKD